MDDDPLTIWLEKVLKWFAVLMATALVLLWLTGCYKPKFHVTLYEAHTHNTSPPVNPSGLNSNETRGGGDFKGEANGRIDKADDLTVFERLANEIDSGGAGP